MVWNWVWLSQSKEKQTNYFLFFIFLSLSVDFVDTQQKFSWVWFGLVEFGLARVNLVWFK